MIRSRVALPRSGASAHCAALARGRARTAAPRASCDSVGAITGTSTPCATACPALAMRKAIEPFGRGSCSSVSVSPGRTGFTNFAAPMRQRVPAHERCCSTARSISSSSSTPGRIGAPGKCPASAGCSAAMVTVTALTRSRLTAGAPRRGTSGPPAEACRCWCAAGAPPTAAGAAGKPDRSAGAAPAPPGPHPAAGRPRRRPRGRRRGARRASHRSGRRRRRGHRHTGGRVVTLGTGQRARLRQTHRSRAI